MSKIFLRRISDGEITNHHFISPAHAAEWLKADKSNDKKFTVCLGDCRRAGPQTMGGTFQQNIYDVEQEMTVKEFLENGIQEKDSKSGKAIRGKAPSRT